MGHLAKVEARLLLLCTRVLALSFGDLSRINRRLSLVLCKAWIEAQTQLRVELLGLKVFAARFEQASLSHTKH